MINGAVLNGAGRVFVVEGLTINPPTGWSNGLPYEGAGIAINVANGAPTSYNAGLGFVGERLNVAVIELTPPNPDYNAGWLIKANTAAMFMNYTLPIAGYINGWPVAANGTVCASTAAPGLNAFTTGFSPGFD